MHRTWGATYGQGAVKESFRPTEAGIEQSFHVASRVSGSGPLEIDVPVSGLSATTDDGAIDLHDARGRIQATYSGLRVTDSSGKAVPATMRAAPHENAIVIEIHDTGARYPLTVDPTWSQVPELTAVGADGFGYSMAISGTTAIFGSWEQAVNGNTDQGAAYVFSSSGGTWTKVAELTASDGAAYDLFGSSVAISGTTAIVGAPGHTVNGNTDQGAAYVFSSSGGTWTQAELTTSDGTASERFGCSVAISGTTAIVGAYGYGVNESLEGAAYVFSSSGGTWTKAAVLTPPGGAAPAGFGWSVAFSGTTVVVGAPFLTVNGKSFQGAAYVLSSSGGTWTKVAELIASDGAAYDFFGGSVALSGTTAIVGVVGMFTQMRPEDAAYVFSSGGGTWTRAAELTAFDEGAGDWFGSSVAISGTTAIVGSRGHTVNGNTDQGAAYVFSSSGSTWIQNAELTAADGAGGDGFGSSVAISGTTAFVGAPNHAVNGKAGVGVAYEFTGPFVQPQGSAVGADARGGGTKSEPALCQCKSGGNTATPSTGEPVNTATGDFYESTTDLSLPGPGVPLVSTRTYDAQAAQAEAAAGQPAPPLGYGWSYNLGMSLAYDSSTQTATITEENDAQTTFVPYVADTSSSWCSGSTNFCATTPRIEATLNENSDGTWTYVRTTGGQETFTFTSAGALSSIADSAGDSLSSSAYSPGSGQTSCPAGDTCVAWSSSASGRELVLAFNSSGQLTSVFDANSTLAASFSYSGSGCTTWGSGQTPDLCMATDPGDLTTTYTYDSGNSSASFDYDMLTETPPGASGPATNVYDTSGRITQQTDPSGAVTTFSYSGTNLSLTGGDTTVISYPFGTGSGEPEDATVYQYSSNVLVGETTGAGTASASTQMFDRDLISLLPLSVQDGDGNLSSSTYQTYSGAGGTPVSSANALTTTDAMGNTTQNAYNAYNQAWCTVDAADYANDTRCPSSAPTSPPAPGSSDPDLGMTISFYNSSDQLTATTDALGNTTTYSYTSGVSGVPSGLQYCSVDPVSYQKGVTCPPYGAAHVTGTATHTFDSAGDTLSSTDADGDTSTYVYNSMGHPGLVSSETDPDGTTTSYTYNGAGQVTSQIVSFGSYSAITLDAYDSYGRKFCEVDPYEAAKGVTCPSSAPSSPPTPSSDPYLGATITTYDPDGRTVQVTNPLGGMTYTAYDQAGEVFCEVDPSEAAKGVTCPSSAPSSPPTIGNDPYLGATITTYDPDGRTVQVTNPLGGITLTAYDAAGNVLQTTVESNNATTDPNILTTNSYDADNRVVSTTVGSGSPNPSTTLTFYDPNGNAFCTVSANAYAERSSSYQCTAWQASWISAPPSPSALYSSTPTSAQANNVTTTFSDANGDQFQSTNPDVQTSVTAVDADGRTYCTSDATNVSAWLSSHTSGTYPYLCPSAPPSSPPAKGSNPGYITTIFDAAGRTLSSTDQAGDTTTTAYDPAGHVLTTTDPRGEVTTNCFYFEDASGQCAASAPAGGGSGDDLYSTTTPATTADPSGETTTYTYYPGDKTDVTTTPAGRTTDTYDALADLTGVTYSNTASRYSTPANVSYTYYTDGSRNTMTDATGTTTYTYDANGDVTSQILVAASGSGLANTTTSYGYFTTGVLASVTYPSYAGHVSPQVTYTYDALGNMASETDWLGNEVAFTHDQDGNLSSQDNDVSSSDPNGTSSTAFSYDNADQNTQASSTLAQTCGGNETLTQSFSGTGGSRNADDQLTEYSDNYTNSCSAQGSYERNYSYDTAGRVVYQGSSSQGSASNNLAYDSSGDPTTISSHDSSGNLDTYSQAFDSAGEVTSQTPISESHGVSSSYSYDTLGDQTEAVSGSSATTYGFDQIGQMTSATSPAGSSTYLYNGDGLEAAAQVPGTTPGPPTSVDASNVLEAVSCTSSSFCAAVDNDGNALTYNGTSWSAVTPVDGLNTLDAVSCTSSSFCAAMDNDGNALTYNGTSWSSASSVDGTNVLEAVSCASSSFCVAVDNKGNALTYNGTSWSSAKSIDSTRTIEAVSCPTTGFCMAVDNKGNALTYNGTSWSSAKSVDGTNTLEGVSCPTTGFCVAVDNKGNALTYNGSSWSSAKSVDGTNTLEAVSCATASFCVAVDNDGNALSYNGTSWSGATSIDSTRKIEGISCPTTSFCAAVDSKGNALTYGSTSWSAATSIDGTNTLEAVSCSSSSFCVAVDNKGDAITYNGTSWSAATSIDGTNVLEAVSCAGSSFCAAVDNKGNALTYNGTSWSSAKSVDGTRKLVAVSCPTTGFCMAVDNQDNAVSFNGTSWTLTKWIEPTDTLEAVSCSSSSFCVAVDNAGHAITYNSTSWSAAASIDADNTLEAVSCTSSTFCVAVDNNSNALLYNGTSWSATSINGTSVLDSVSCSSFSFCVAVDNKGDAITYNGTNWSATSSIDSTRKLDSISCPAMSSCVAVDSDGNAMLYAAVPDSSASQLTWDTNASLPTVLSDGTNDYIYGPSTTPVEAVSLSSSTPSYMTYTPSDSTWFITNATGDETAFYGYDAFGNLAFGTPVSPFGYAGQYTDPSTGFSDLRARWYGAQTGTFTTRDPAFASTNTAYTYADDDPVNASDPSGMGLFGICTSLSCLENDALDVATVGQSGIVEGEVQTAQNLWNCNDSVLSCFNENLNPAYGILINGQSAWEGWSNPCVSALSEAGNILQTGESVAATAAVAYGGLKGGEAGIGALGGSAGGGVVAESGEPQILANQAAGNAFRDATANRLTAEGWNIVGTEVRVNTPLGVRITDILAERNGDLVGFETKVGASRYLPSQIAKDTYISRFGGTLGDGSTIRYPTVLIRGTS